MNYIHYNERRRTYILTGIIREDIDCPTKRDQEDEENRHGGIAR